MNRILLTLAVAAVAAGVWAEGPFTIKAVCDKADCKYQAGDEATFTLEVSDAKGQKADSGELTVVFDDFGPTVFASNKVDLAKTNPIVLKGRREKPGFLRVRVIGEVKNPISFSKEFAWGAVFSEDKIVQTHACPADFDRFWADARAKLAKEVPLDPQLVKDEARSQRDRAFNWYKVSFATFGKRVHGWLSVPKTAGADNKVPVHVHVPGAGFGWYSQNGESRKGVATLFMTVFPFAPDTDLEKTRPLYEAWNKERMTTWKEDGYAQSGITGAREDYVYYPVILGIDRAVDWLVKQDFADARYVTYAGTSQGGGFGLFLMGLNKNFTRGISYVPAITGHYQAEEGRQNGWPQLLTKYSSENAHSCAFKNQNGQECPFSVAARNAAYFDGVNFAARITCPVKFIYGFVDPICAPHAVISAYNACSSKDKELRGGLGMSHGVFGEFYWGLEGWLYQRPQPETTKAVKPTKEECAWFESVFNAHMKDVEILRGTDKSVRSPEARCGTDKSVRSPIAVFLGDSLIAGFHDTRKYVWNQYFKEGRYRGINLGIGGDTTQGVLWRIREGKVLDGYTAKYVVVEIGTNNLGNRNDGVDDVVAGIRQVVSDVMWKQPKATVVVLPILPRGKELANPVRRRAELVNAELKAAYETSHRVLFLDLYDKFLKDDGSLDGYWYVRWPSNACDWLHPNESGYRLLAREIEKCFMTFERRGPYSARPELKDLSWTWHAMEGYRNQVRAFKGKHVNFLLVGDSITDALHSGERKAILDRMMNGRTYYNIGVSGDETSHTLWRLETGGLDELTVDGIMLMIGTNNLGNQNRETAEEAAPGVCRILDVLREKFPNAKILQLATFPRGATSNDALRVEVAKLNALVKDYAKGDARVTYMDLAPKFLEPDGRLLKTTCFDFLHPTEAGDQVWMDAVKPWFDAVPLTDGTGLKSFAETQTKDEKPWRDAVKPRIGSAWGGDPARAKDAEGWLKRHEAFLAEAKARNPEVIFLGDSITDMFQNSIGSNVWNRAFKSVAVDMGISGDRTENVLWRVQNGAVDTQPKVAVLMIGVNNIGAPGETTLDTFLGVKAILAEIERRSPKTKTVLLSVMPWGYEPSVPMRETILRLNETLRTLESGDSVVWLDIFNEWLDADGFMTKEMSIDSLHPNVLGYERWTRALWPTLSRLLK